MLGWHEQAICSRASTWCQRPSSRTNAKGWFNEARWVDRLLPRLGVPYHGLEL